MWVDSLIKRIQGHTVELDGVVYAFNSDTGYCCEVTDPDHLAIFRGVPEGYQVSGAAAPAAEPEPVAPAPKRRTRRFTPPAPPVLMPDGRD